MKNPMTLKEKHQALDDNAAGYSMQRRILYGTQENRVWKDRFAADGSELNFRDCEYRRKPEQVVRYANVYEQGIIGTHANVESAKKAAQGNRGFVRRIQLVENPNWVEQEPAMPAPTPMNPWRPIVKGEWPECKPNDEIVKKLINGEYVRFPAGMTNWSTTTAVEWKYAEDS